MDCLISVEPYYLASPDWVKALWVVALPVFIAFMTSAVLWYRVQIRRLGPVTDARQEDRSRTPDPRLQ